MSATAQDLTWDPVCALEDLLPERGAAALVGDAPVALFRLADDSLHCIDHRDPFSGANVLARGLVGTREVNGEHVPVVVSPMYKQAFDLRTGACLDDPAVSVAVRPVRVTGGVVEVGS